MYDKEIDNLDWGAQNFEVYGVGYQEEPLPGFGPSVYKILEESTNEENKVIDTRPPTLKITHEETTWSLLTHLAFFYLEIPEHFSDEFLYSNGTLLTEVYKSYDKPQILK